MTNGQSGGTNSTTGGHTDHPTKLHPQKVMECDNFLSFHAQCNTKEQTLMNQSAEQILSFLFSRTEVNLVNLIHPLGFMI